MNINRMLLLVVSLTVLSPTTFGFSPVSPLRPLSIPFRATSNVHPQRFIFSSPRQPDSSSATVSLLASSSSHVDHDDDFDRSIDTILDAMYGSSDLSVRRKVKDLELDLEQTHVETFWLTRVINAWARSTDPQATKQVTFVLECMNRLYDAGYNYVRPNTVTYNSVINCWVHSKTAKNAAEKSQELLTEMWHLVDTRINPSARPSTITYSSVIKAWSKSNQFDIQGPRAEALLREQWDRYEEQSKAGRSSKPDAKTYNNVLAAWANSKQPESYERALLLVNEMWDRYAESNDENMKPDKVTMTCILTALSNRRNDPEAGNKAEAVVQEMWELAKTDSNFKPNAIVYTTLMQVWLHNRSPGAIIRMQALMDEMKERFYDKGEADFRPTLVAYSVLMEKLALVPLSDAADRAEALLQEMWDRTKRGESFVTPNPNVYIHAIQARTKNRQKDSPDQAERLLDDMITRFKNGDRRLAPNVAAFLMIIKANGRQNQRKPGFPDKIHNLLNKMYDLQNAGVRKASPERLTLTTVMDILTRNYDRSSLLKAEEILHTTWKKSVGSGRPDSVTYLTLMSAWTKSRAPDAVERSEAMYKEMWRRYEETGNPRVKPDTTICNAMITAYAKSRRPDAFEKAKEILDDMVRRNQEGDVSVRPDTVSYNSLLNALSKSKVGGAAEKAESILREMWLEKKTEALPNVVTISTVIDAWSHSEAFAAPVRAQAILDEARQRYHEGDTKLKPNEFTYTPAILAWCLSKHKEGPFKAEELMMRMWEEGLKPNKIIYGHIISSYGKLKSKEGAERAEALLRDQWRRQDAGDKSVKPDVLGCNAVIIAWTNSHADAAPDRVNAILNEMLERASQGDHDVRPSRVTYNTVLTAWGKSGRSDGAQKAEDLVNALWDRFPANSQRRPDRINFTNVMSAWARSGNPIAPDKASAILANLWKLAKNGDETMKPDTAAYASTILAFVNSGRDDAYKKAKVLFQEMKDNNIAFNTRFFITYIKALGSKPETGDEIVATLSEMELLSDQGVDCKPDTFVYNSVISNLVKYGQLDDIKQAQTVLDDMWRRYNDTGDKEYKPNISTYTLLVRAYRKIGTSSSNDDAQKLLDDISRRYEAGDTSFELRGSLFEKADELKVDAIADGFIVNPTVTTSEVLAPESDDGEIWIDQYGHIRYTKETQPVT